MKRRPRIVPLEERIVLDAAAAAVVAEAVATAATHTAAPPTSDNHTTDTQTSNSTTPTNVIYVNASATGTVHDGTTWNTAYVSLQNALDKAAQTTGSDQIWIAKGTYIPSKIYAPTDSHGNSIQGGAAALDPSVTGLDLSKMVTFNIPDNVQLLGGFLSGMTSASQRDPLHNTTILNGDLLGNDINDPTNAGYAASKADNAWHVVMMGNDVTQTGVHATLDGITITDGYAAGPDLPFGSYLYNHSFGGGAYINFGSTVTLNQVTFTNNFAWGDGGGLYTNNTDILVKNSSFIGNTSVVRGGAFEALNTYETDPVTGANVTAPHIAKVVDSLFRDNTCWTFGGAIVGEGTFARHDSALIVEDSTFINNHAAEGGAIVIDSLNVYVDDSTFIGNEATVSAGALATTSIVNSLFGGPNDFATVVTDSSFINNVADGDVNAHAFLNSLFTGFIPGFVIDFSRGGGALVSYMTGRLIVDNSSFINNVAKSGDGGAILNGHSMSSFYGVTFQERASTVVTNSLFVGNKALDGSGGAIASDSLIGLQYPSTGFANVLSVTGSLFTNNRASLNGGAISLDGAIANIRGNLFTPRDDALGLGDQIYANDSNINGFLTGILSSEILAKRSLVLNNIFLALDSDDLWLS